MDAHGCVPRMPSLTRQLAGRTWPVGCGLLTPGVVVGRAPYTLTASEVLQDLQGLGEISPCSSYDVLLQTRRKKTCHHDRALFIYCFYLVDPILLVFSGPFHAGLSEMAPGERDRSPRSPSQLWQVQPETKGTCSCCSPPDPFPIPGNTCSFSLRLE